MARSALDLFDINDLKNKKVIAIAGAKGCGKSTLAAALALDADNATMEIGTYELFAFADRLKAILMQAARMPWYMFSNPAHKESPVRFHSQSTTPREMMQKFGTELVRTIDPNFWITNTLIDIYFSTSDFVIIHDLRMVNEAQALRKYTDVVLIKVIRDGCDGDDHQSECEHKSIDFDFVVENNSDVATMVNIVNNYLKVRYS